MIEDPTRAQYVTEDPEPVIAGTLCLMSAFAQRPCPGVAHKVIRNLEVLMRHPGCSATLRGYCDELRQRWVSELVGARTAQATRGASIAGEAPSPAEGIRAAPSDDTPIGIDGGEHAPRGLASRTLH